MNRSVLIIALALVLAALALGCTQDQAIAPQPTLPDNTLIGQVELVLMLEFDQGWDLDLNRTAPRETLVISDPAEAAAILDRIDTVCSNGLSFDQGFNTALYNELRYGHARPLPSQPAVKRVAWGKLRRLWY